MNKKTVFISLFIIFVLFSALLFVFNTANSRIKAYYSGDAIVYNETVIVGSVNMKGLELFKLENNNLKKVTKIRSFRSIYSGYDDFNDLLFNIEDNKLFVYLIDGTYIYKYDITNLSNPLLVMQVKDNSWDWFGALNKVNNRIVTAGTKDIKIWNTNLELVDRYNIVIKNFHNINFSQNGKFIFVIDNNNLKIFDTDTRQFVSNILINSQENHNRNVFNDQNENYIYLVDDEAIKKFDFTGLLVNKNIHSSKLGYQIASSIDKKYLYFTDGIGIVKAQKSDLKPYKWAYTTDLGEKGGWAMGLEIVYANGKEKVIIFNNSTILALDDNLKLIGFYKSVDQEIKPEIKEGLYLKADKIHAAPNSSVLLHGGGYGTNEKLTIDFANQKTNTQTDNDGRFSIILTVPSVLPMKTDIKVTGDLSGLSYSLGFIIE